MKIKTIVHKNPWFSVEKNILSNNNEYYVIKKRPTVFILAETKDQKIVFIREYRYPIHKNILQLPAGMVDKETPLSAAKRELNEETHLKANKWRKLGEFYVAPGHETTKIIAFYASDLIEKNEEIENETDIINIEKLTKRKVVGLIKSRRIVCGITLAVLNLYFNSK